MGKIQLKKDQVVWIGRHGNCNKAQSDNKRELSEKGMIESNKIGGILSRLGFMNILSIKDPLFISKQIIVNSPAIRTEQTSRIMFVSQDHERCIFDELYNFDQFEGSKRIYHPSRTDIRECIRLDQENILKFQEKPLNFFLEFEIFSAQNVVIMSHAIISNFVAMMFTEHPMVYEEMLPESGGFLITKDSCQFIAM